MRSGLGGSPGGVWVPSGLGGAPQSRHLQRPWFRLTGGYFLVSVSSGSVVFARGCLLFRFLLFFLASAAWMDDPFELVMRDSVRGFAFDGGSGRGSWLYGALAGGSIGSIRLCRGLRVWVISFPRGCI